MKKRIARIAPLKTGMVLAVFYAIMALFMVPVFLLMGIGAAATAARQGSAQLPFAFIFGAGAFMLPVLYGIIGFIFGVISAAIYNLVAKWTGGIEVTVENVV